MDSGQQEYLLLQHVPPSFYQGVYPRYGDGALNHCAYVDASGALNFIPVRSNRIYRYSVSSFASDSTKVHQSVSSLLLHNHPIMHSFAHQGTFIFMDDANDLYLYDVRNKSKLYIRNVGDCCRRYGRFFDIFPFYDDILITLHNGVSCV